MNSNGDLFWFLLVLIGMINKQKDFDIDNGSQVDVSD